MEQDQDSPPPPADADAKAQKGEGAFDLWLQRSLHQLYDSVTAEPIPPELLRLIDEDRSSRGR